MNKVKIGLVLIILVLALALLSCGGGDEGNGSGIHVLTNSGQTIILAPDATATYGADQLHIQLTAIADQNR